MSYDVAPLRLISKLRNNRMIRARESLGMSAPQIAETIHMSYGTWVALESLRESPLRANGEWRQVALRIADWFKVMPEDMWPEEALAVERATMEIEVSASEARVLMGSTQEALPDYRVELEAAGLESALRTLMPRERKILGMRFGLDGEEATTFEQAATVLGISRERLRQIEAKALRKLRHPSRADRILGVEETHADTWSDPNIVRCRRCGSPLTRKSPNEVFRCGCGRTVSA